MVSDGVKCIPSYVINLMENLFWWFHHSAKCVDDFRSNDKADDKQFAVMVRYFDTSRLKPSCDIASWIAYIKKQKTKNSATAKALFQSCKECLISNELSWDNILSFISDTCNTK